MDRESMRCILAMPLSIIDSCISIDSKLGLTMCVSSIDARVLLLSVMYPALINFPGMGSVITMSVATNGG